MMCCHDSSLLDDLVLDTRRLLDKRLVQICILGRSGTTLLFSYLDGHPEIASLPGIFKFYDFLFFTPGLLKKKPEEIAFEFILFPAHAQLFDTRKNILFSNGLGENSDVFVRIDLVKFINTLTYLLDKIEITSKNILYCAIASYNYCIGRSIATAKIVLQALHHPEWIVRECQPNRSMINENCPLPDFYPDDVFFVERDLNDITRSHFNLAYYLTSDWKSRINYYESLLQLSCQNYFARFFLKKKGIRVFSFYLGDIKEKKKLTLQRVCSILDIEYRESFFKAPSFFGFLWKRDAVSLSKQILPEEVSLDADVFFVNSCLSLLPEFKKISPKKSLFNFLFAYYLPPVSLRCISGPFILKYMYILYVLSKRRKFVQNIKVQYVESRSDGVGSNASKT